MKCCYDPKVDSKGNCVQCNVPLCGVCFTDAELNEGLCQACLRQKKFIRAYSYIRITVCTVGIAWLIIAFFIFGTAEGWTKPLTYGLLGIFGAFGINMLSVALISRTLLANLKPHQKVFVALARYSVSGQKVFFTQAIRAMKKVENMDEYKDALFDQLVSILILQPYNLPADWVEYLSENFKITKDELLSGMIDYGLDMFDESIFDNHYYQAIEPLIEIYKRTERNDLYSKLTDRIMDRLQTVDLKAVNRAQPIQFQGMIPQQQTQQKLPASVIRDRAFLTELKLIDAELEEFLLENKRKADWQTLDEIVSKFDLPRVPKGTFEATRSLLKQPQEKPQGPDGIPGTFDDAKEISSKPKICAECGISYSKDQLKPYNYEGVPVNVCVSCLTKLEDEGHREPRLLAGIRKPKDNLK